MTVNELIERLLSCDGNLEVRVRAADSSVATIADVRLFTPVPGDGEACIFIEGADE